jgi:hypothetical protein
MSDYPQHDAYLRRKLEAVIRDSGTAKKAMEAAAKYWRDSYNMLVPNAENQLVPASLIEILERLGRELGGLQALLEKVK